MTSDPKLLARARAAHLYVVDIAINGRFVDPNIRYYSASMVITEAQQQELRRLIESWK